MASAYIAKKFYAVYPNLYFFVKEVFGIEIEFLKIFQMFGLFMAISFLIAYWAFSSELKRLEAEGKIHPFKRKFWLNKAPGTGDYAMNFIFYFVLGFKVVGAFFDFRALTSNPQEFILSTKGNLIGGLLAGAIGLYIVYRDAQKVKGKQPIEEERLVHPYEMMGNITGVAAVTGLLGAKLFHILENMDEFYADPMGSILSFSGLTFYGSLICGGLGVLWYTGKLGIYYRHMIDAGAAGMMLAYGVGRIGCHVAGDGDWGIVNTSPKPGWLSWLPDWAWAYNYPNNVNQVCNPYTEGHMAMVQCNFAETPYLIAPVYPTPLYEALMGILLFLLMWSVRKKIKYPGVLFCLYLVLAGIERFLIEKIRVNNIMDFMGMQATQAEIISVIMILLGIGLALFFIAKPPKKQGIEAAASTGT